jgi:hypothetical protein
MCNHKGHEKKMGKSRPRTLSRASFCTPQAAQNCIMRAAGGAKNDSLHLRSWQVPDQDVQLQRAREKNGQMKITYLVEGVVLHAAGGRRHKIALCAPQAPRKWCFAWPVLPQAPQK